jgi:hypothetical protein
MPIFHGIDMDTNPLLIVHYDDLISTLAPCIVLLMNVLMISCIASAILHPLQSVQCFLGLFFAFKTQYNSLRASNSHIGQPWLRKWKIVAN